MMSDKVDVVEKAYDVPFICPICGENIWGDVDICPTCGGEV